MMHDSGWREAARRAGTPTRKLDPRGVSRQWNDKTKKIARRSTGPRASKTETGNFLNGDLPDEVRQAEDHATRFASENSIVMRGVSGKGSITRNALCKVLKHASGVVIGD